MNRNKFKILALGGFLGPILFTSMIIICAELRPDYNHLHDFISALGASGTQYEFLMNFAGFIASGLLLALFGIHLLLNLPKGAILKIGSIIIITFGLGMSVAGVYSCDEGCIENITFESKIHDQVSALIFFLITFGLYLFGFAFRKYPELKKYSIFSFLLGIFATVFLVAMINSLDANKYTGLWQRLFLLSIFSWTAVIGLSFYQYGNKINTISEI